MILIYTSDFLPSDAVLWQLGPLDDNNCSCSNLSSLYRLNQSTRENINNKTAFKNNITEQNNKFKTKTFIHKCVHYSM